MKIIFISTDHTVDRLWFKDDDDYRTGMNYVAITSYKLGVRVLSFILMSNHVHFVLFCREEDARHFIDEYKNLYGRYLSKKYGIKEALRRVGVDIQIIPQENEAGERCIAYTNMNSVAANICMSPEYYPWGTGPCFYRTEKRKGRHIGDFSEREQHRLLRSCTPLPKSYLIGEDGYILPESYIDVAAVERLFRTPKRYNYFLRSSSKAKERLSRENSDLPSFRDQIIVQAVLDLCRSLFRKEKPEELNESQLTELFRQIRYRFSADVNQIARTCGFEYSTVANLVDGI